MNNQPNPNVFFRGEDMGIGNFPIKGGTINDGGPAFPCEEQIRCNGEVCDIRKFTGVTIRDYFAAAALQGFCANQHSCPTKNEHFKNLADDSYKAADAMIKSREVKL
jgi:hypothetical protein